ncbi:MAG: cysteine desulfurase family protein [Actinomycetota bacterium]|nr:cysteine desulfurase family protein [Actinomycetota bacterium]
MRRHYLDNASTVPLRPEAAAAIREWLDSPAGDPGRVHEEGRAVRDAVEAAREQVAALLAVRPRQVVFTSGGTEAVHAAVWAAMWERPGGAALCAPVEHSSVQESSARLAPVVPLPVDRTGRIDPEGVDDALDRAGRAVSLVHCQWANHEVGTLQPVLEIVERCRRAGAPVHVDAAAACGHLEMDLEDGPDFVSVSAHKLGGPPGVGALVVGRGRRVAPLFVGGQQERARRAGMENVCGIVGFGAAAAALSEGALGEETLRARAQTASLAGAVLGVPGTLQVGDPDSRLPHVVCFGVEGVQAEPVVIGLDRLGIAVHSGSACASEALEPSAVLAAMGEDPTHSLRLSVGWSTTDADIEAFAEAFRRVVGELRALRP